MRRIAFSLLIAAALMALPAAAQIKTPQPKNPKDEGLHYVLLREFSRVNQTLSQLSDRVSALEGEMARLKQQNADVGTEMRTVGEAVKDTEKKVSDQLLNSERTLITITRDLVQVRADLASVLEQVRRNQVVSAPPVVEPAPGLTVEGYIMEVAEREVKISLGASQGSHTGWRLGVYAAADPKTQIGTVVVTEVIDANNSKAEIILMSPGARFQFSDIVRPIT